MDKTKFGSRKLTVDNALLDAFSKSITKDLVKKDSVDEATVQDLANELLEKAKHSITSTERERMALSKISDALSNEQIIELYNTLIFEEELGIEPTLDLVTLIRKIDFEKVNYSDDDTGYLVLKLDDLCKVYPVTKYDTHAEYNGSFSIMIEIYTKSGANTTSTVNKVKDIINDNSTGSMILLLDDQSDDIMTSIMSVVESMILGGILAIIVLFVFLRRVRTSIIISITMPLSILAALLCLYLNGTTINLVTLGGLAVGIGMLVDNSIVVIECISKRREAGETIYDACINGTSEVGGSLVASTLTTIIVFVPILFTTGLTKEIFTINGEENVVIPEGYAFNTELNDGYYETTLIPAIVKIEEESGTKYFGSITEAVAYASNHTITLLANTITECVVVDGTKKFIEPEEVLDLI